MPTWIAIDDTDSYGGGCTTWIAAKVAAEFRQRLTDFPCLIRLNPEIPWKTRGNGALLLALDDLTPSEKERLKALVAENSFNEGKTSPGLIICEEILGRPDLGRKALTDVVTQRLMEKALQSLAPHATIFTPRPGRRRGLIGCLGALNHRWSDYTFELIAYRKDVSREREIRDLDALYMDSLTAPVTFLNYDRTHGKPLVYPHGPDPVLYGIRGEDPNVLLASHWIMGEPSDFWLVFKTNQGTDEHIVDINSFSDARPYRTVRLKATVTSEPKVQQGGHVILRLRDLAGVAGEAIVYRQSEYLKYKAAELREGDSIIIWGGVSPRVEKPTINAQGIKVISLNNENNAVPRCPICDKPMKEVNAGIYSCEVCGTRATGKSKEPLPRHLHTGRTYRPSSSGFKHLMKPGNRRKLPINYRFNQNFLGNLS